MPLLSPFIYDVIYFCVSQFSFCLDDLYGKVEKLKSSTITV